MLVNCTNSVTDQVTSIQSKGTLFPGQETLVNFFSIILGDTSALKKWLTTKRADIF